MLLERLFRWRLYPGAFQAGTLAATGLVAVLALLPPRHSEVNVGAVLAWQLWWALLPFTVLLAARTWCAVCPFPALGTLAQRVRPPAPPPPALVRRLGPWTATMGLSALGFLFLLLSLETNGPATAALLGAFAVGSVATALVWRGRAWCRYLCPIGLMTGLYSRLAWVRLESRSPADGIATAVPPCPVSTSPASPRRTQDCVLCAACLKHSAGDSVAVRFGPPSMPLPSLTSAEAAAVTVLAGLLLADAWRMTPLYSRFIAWTLPGVGGSYDLAMGLGVAGLVGLLLAGQAGIVGLSRRGESFGARFVHASAALVPLALAAHLALSAQHLSALGEVARNLGAELGLLAPGHLPPADLYVTWWPLKGLQLAGLAAGGVVSLLLAGGGTGRLQVASSILGAALALALLVLFALPMSASC